MCFLELHRKLLWVVRLRFDSRESLRSHLVRIVIISIVMLGWHVGIQMRLLSKSLSLEELRRVKTSERMRWTLCSSWNTGYWQVGHNWLRKIEALVAVVLSVNIVAVVNLTLSPILGESMSLGDYWLLTDFFYIIFGLMLEWHVFLRLPFLLLFSFRGSWCCLLRSCRSSTFGNGFLSPPIHLHNISFVSGSVGVFRQEITVLLILIVKFRVR